MSEALRRWGNTLLTILLIIVIASLVIRWRAVHAAQARLNVLSQLSSAQTLVQGLASENPSRPVATLAASRLNLTAQATDALAGVLNGTDDATLRAQALVTRGDLYWHLANLPELPGATTQPSLRPETPPDQALQRAAQAYQEVLDSYSSQHQQATAARFGLAAVAENKHDWSTAQKQLQAVIDDPAAEPAFHDQAQRELTVLPTLNKQLYLATSQPTTMAASSITGSAPAPTAPSPASIQPVTTPRVGSSPRSVVAPLSSPATEPATGPAAPAVVQPASHPTSASH